jgi:hypothetical protein
MVASFFSSDRYDVNGTISRFHLCHISKTLTILKPAIEDVTFVFICNYLAVVEYDKRKEPEIQ